MSDDAEEMKLRAERAEASIAALAPYAAIGLAALYHWRQGWDMDGETLHDELRGAGVLVDDADKGEHAPGEDAARAALLGLREAAG